MALGPFAGFRPRRYLYVSPSGNDRSSGGPNDPLATLQAAADRAEPGTAVMARRGAYAPVKLPSRRGGGDQTPIWFISADGPLAARIASPDPKTTCFKGLGVFNIALCGFEIVGGDNGVQFSQSGADFSAPCRNLLIAGNSIRGARQDGVKISQADNVFVLDNVVAHCGDQCIDFVNVWKGVAARNDLSDPGSSAALFCKGGSRSIRFEDNYIHDVRGYTISGILIGGYSKGPVVRPGSPDTEAVDVIVRGNRVERVSGYALSVLGGRKVRVSGNYLESRPDPSGASASIIGIEHGVFNARPVPSEDVEIAGNILGGDKREWLFGRKSQDPARDRLSVRDNRRGEAWSGEAGPKPLPKNIFECR